MEQANSGSLQAGPKKDRSKTGKTNILDGSAGGYASNANKKKEEESPYDAVEF
jgi:hypothetical protein